MRSEWMTNQDCVNEGRSERCTTQLRQCHRPEQIEVLHLASGRVGLLL